MELHYVDIYGGPGVNLRADACLRLAEQHGARGVVEQLLPYTVHGPGYVRGIREELAAAISRFHMGHIDMANVHVDHAIRSQPISTRTLHRPGNPPTPPSTTGHRSQTPTVAHHIEVHIYDTPTSTALVPSHTLSTDWPIAAGGLTDIDRYGNPVAPDASWQRQLRARAHSGNVTVVTVSDPRQVRPEHRADDQRWAQAARQAAAAADPGAPWVALRPRPDAALLLIGAAVRPSPARHHRVAAAAASVLHRAPAGHPHPPPTGPAPTAVPTPAGQPPPPAPRIAR